MLNLTKEKLLELQSLSLDNKIDLTKELIRYVKNKTDKKLAVAFSGGKDSSVLLDITRDLYPNTPALFANTTNEHKYILDFVKETDNVMVVHPKKPFKQVLKESGYPFVSKEFSEWYSRVFRWVHIDKTDKRFHTAISYVLVNNKYIKFRRWLWLLDEKMFDYIVNVAYHFNYDNTLIEELKNLYKNQYYLRKKYNIVNKKIYINNHCCSVLKKAPLLKKEIKEIYFKLVGTMADESLVRQKAFLNSGWYNDIQAMPMFFWKEEDIWEYIKKYNLEISKAYETENRTGCVVCGFGLTFDKSRFDRVGEITPKRLESLLKVKNIYSDLTFGEVYEIIIDFIK